MGKLKGQKKQNRGKGIKWQIEKKVDLKEQCLWLGVRKYWDYIYPLELVWNLNLLNENRRNPLEIKYKTYKWHQSKVAGNHFEAVTLNWMRQKTSYSFSSEIQQWLWENLFHQALYVYDNDLFTVIRERQCLNLWRAVTMWSKMIDFHYEKMKLKLEIAKVTFLEIFLQFSRKVKLRLTTLV